MHGTVGRRQCCVSPIGTLRRTAHGPTADGASRGFAASGVPNAALASNGYGG